MGGKAKGNKFERDICTRLSLWWSGDKRDDLFWRTGGSGGRANVRSQKGKKTHGQHGDICATHPDGDSLINRLTIELKRGYNRRTVADLLDKPKGAARQEMEGFYGQAIESNRQAGTLSWLLVHRRDRRDAIIFFPDELFESLCLFNCFTMLPVPFASFLVRVDGEVEKIVCMKLEAFLRRVHPDNIKRLVKK